MDIRKFDYFMSVAELGSFSRAAVSLRLSQPLLSRQVRTLEEELGLPLFYRNGRGVTLTQAGRCLLKNARTVRDAVEMTYNELNQLKSQLVGAAAIGMPTSVGRAVSVDLAQHFARHTPDVKLHIVEGLSSDIAEQIQQGRLDVAILYTPIRNQSILSDPVVVEHLVLVSAPGQGPDAPVSMDDLLRLPLVTSGPNQQLRRDLEQAARARGVQLNIAVEVDSLTSILQMVNVGLGHAVLPPSALVRHGLRDHFDVASFTDDIFHRTLYVGTGPQRSDAAPARQLAGVVKETLQRLAGPLTWDVIRA
ncbi:LysR family transcriptional regulator [Novosphingobium guangzhouense]|uniref:HTH lysR-type domain-containing protein n=1 Tax=Novosphingobium guangzhouense TaxID=1850347 RepID=A0A2K2G172_9SPHN|nr:LysR family transcriptional regulator [Novosphingobium guangzhouense]PNU04744.1 hypothetical protein A8V01_18465 [Novosphingobium guangzhouense]